MKSCVYLVLGTYTRRELLFGCQLNLDLGNYLMCHPVSKCWCQWSLLLWSPQEAKYSKSEVSIIQLILSCVSQWPKRPMFSSWRDHANYRPKVGQKLKILIKIGREGGQAAFAMNVEWTRFLFEFGVRGLVTRASVRQLYRVARHVSDLWCDNFDLGRSTFGLFLLGLVRDGLPRHGSAVGKDEWNIQIKVDPNRPCPRRDGPPRI